MTTSRVRQRSTQRVSQPRVSKKRMVASGLDILLCVRAARDDGQMVAAAVAGCGAGMSGSDVARAES
jgi:hypothetical protein